MFCTPLSDFYSLLQVPRDASLHDIKIAYHHTLLRLHPDKQPRLRTRPNIDSALDTATLTPNPVRHPEEGSVDMAVLKEAYRTLSDVGLRTAYDGSLRREEHARSRGPRPAQVVSLEEFTATEMGTETETGTAQEWRYGCRCGGMYRITEADLENGTHLVGCESCSEVIWVGYEEAMTEE